MKFEFDLDMEKYSEALDKAADTISEGLERGLWYGLATWRAEAVDLAPIDKGTLRRSIWSYVEGDGMDLTGEIGANATSKTKGKRFNYAYYIHENGAGGKKLRQSWAEKKFLDVSFERHKSAILGEIEYGIDEALRKQGW